MSFFAAKVVRIPPRQARMSRRAISCPTICGWPASVRVHMRFLWRKQSVRIVAFISLQIRAALVTLRVARSDVNSSVCLSALASTTRRRRKKRSSGSISVLRLRHTKRSRGTDACSSLLSVRPGVGAGGHLQVSQSVRAAHIMAFIHVAVVSFLVAEQWQ